MGNYDASALRIGWRGCALYRNRLPMVALMIDLIISLIGPLGGWAVAAGAIIAALLATWLGGRKSAKTDAKTKDLKANKATRERIDNAPVDDDPTAIRERLSERKR